MGYSGGTLIKTGKFILGYGDVYALFDESCFYYEQAIKYMTRSKKIIL